jgi:hypothetical protein
VEIGASGLSAGVGAVSVDGVSLESGVAPLSVLDAALGVSVVTLTVFALDLPIWGPIKKNPIASSPKGTTNHFRIHHRAFDIRYPIMQERYAFPSTPLCPQKYMKSR